MAAVAGMVIFRTCWVLVRLALGGVTVLWWRRTTAEAYPSELPEGEPQDFHTSGMTASDTANRMSSTGSPSLQ